MASTYTAKQTAVRSTITISSHTRKPSRNSSLSCCLLMTVHFSPTRRKPYSRSPTASLMKPRTLASLSAWRRLRCCTNPLHNKRTVLLRSASMAPTSKQWNTSLTWVVSSPMMPQSAKILTTAFQKPAVQSFFVKESEAEPSAPLLYKDPGIQSRYCFHPPVWCRDLGSVPDADQASRAVSPTLSLLHPWHEMARPNPVYCGQDYVSHEEVLSKAALI